MAGDAMPMLFDGIFLERGACMQVLLAVCSTLLVSLLSTNLINEDGVNIMNEGDTKTIYNYVQLYLFIHSLSLNVKV